MQPLPGTPRNPKKAKGKEGVGDLKPDDPDPDSPHVKHGFVPRPHPYSEGGDIWAFGKAHAALHHVLRNVPGGDPVAAASELDAFAGKQGLKFHLGPLRAASLDNATRLAIAEAAAATSATEEKGRTAMRPLSVLVLGAGLGGRLLRCLPALLESSDYIAAPGGAVHEVVSIERDSHLSGYGDQLFKHTVSSRGHMEEDSPDGESVPHARVGHLPLMPGEDTTLEEILETLSENYDFPSFDLVLLEDGEDGRLGQQHQLGTLLASGALGDGAVVHAEGPGLGDAETDGYLQLLRSVSSGRRFESQVHDIGDGGAAVVSVLRRGGGAGDEEL